MSSNMLFLLIHQLSVVDCQRNIGVVFPQPRFKFYESYDGGQAPMSHYAGDKTESWLLMQYLLSYIVIYLEQMSVVDPWRIDSLMAQIIVLVFAAGQCGGLQTAVLVMVGFFLNGISTKIFNFLSSNLLGKSFWITLIILWLFLMRDI